MTDKLSATMQIAQRIHSLARQLNESAIKVGASRAPVPTVYSLGDFATGWEYAPGGVEIWRSGELQSPVREVTAPVFICLCLQALSEWHLGGTASCQTTMKEGICLAKLLLCIQKNHTVSSAPVDILRTTPKGEARRQIRLRLFQFVFSG